MSSATRRLTSSGVSTGPREPLIAAQPVMPGFMRWRWAYSATSLALWVSPVFMPTACGRGPTSDISPFSTLNSCGSSSRLVRRMTRPTRVTRSSSKRTCWAPPARSELVPHRAELPDQDLLVVEAVAALAEEHRAGAVELDGERDQRHQRQAEQQRQRADDQVLAALDQRPALVAGRAGHRRQRRLGDPRQRRGAAGRALVDEQHHLVGQHLEPLDQLAHPGLGVLRHRDHDAVDVGHDPVRRAAPRCRPAPARRRSLAGMRSTRSSNTPSTAASRLLRASVDQPLGVGGGADDDDVGGQPAGRAPAAHHRPPQAVQRVDAPGSSPGTTGRTGRGATIAGLKPISSSSSPSAARPKPAATRTRCRPSPSRSREGVGLEGREAPDQQPARRPRTARARRSRCRRPPAARRRARSRPARRRRRGGRSTPSIQPVSRVRVGVSASGPHRSAPVAARRLGAAAAWPSWPGAFRRRLQARRRAQAFRPGTVPPRD